MAQRSDLDLEYFRKRLEERRDWLRSEIARLDSESDNVNQDTSYGVKNHPAEDATELFLRERDLALLGEIEDELRAVEHALDRIEEGTYGICEVTGKPIPVERLEARPVATTVVEAQEELDRLNRQGHDLR
jgi:RNA polymerase-binding protein DksA